VHDLSAGTTVGPFRLDSPIGLGATGQVYRATRVADARLVALKIISSPSPEARQHFRLENRALQSLSHPGVVEVVQAGEDDGRAWLAMELVEGAPLDDWISRFSGADRVRRILRAGADVAEALAAVHDQHLLHQDIKPANILVSPAGRVKLVDFGFAGYLDQPDPAGLAGTLRYMSPERLTGTEADRRADLFSLGVVLYELIARRPPHVGTDRNRLILAQCTEPAPSLGELAPEVPAAALRIIDQMLAKSPGERPRSAREVADALRQALDDAPRQARWRPVLRTAPFVGHRSLMDELLRRALAGAPDAMLLHGPPGVGLSRLLQEVQGRVLVRGGRLVLVSGNARLLFQVLDGLVGALRPADTRRALLGPDRELLLAAWPDLGRPTEDIFSLSRPPTPLDLANAVRGVLRRTAARQPLFIAVDDAEGADPRDLGLLQGAGLLLLASHEPARIRGAMERRTLLPLDRAQLAALASSMIGRTGPRLVMEHAPTIAGLPGRLVAAARGDAAPDEPESPVTARLHPWETAVQAAEDALHDRSPHEALGALAHAAAAAPSPELQHRAELVRSRAALQQGHLDEARQHATAAAELAPTEIDCSEARLAGSRAALRAGELRAVADQGRRAAAAAGRMGQPGLAARWDVLRARACLRSGALREAAQILAPHLAQAPLEPAALLGVLWTAAEVAVHRCDWAHARRLLITAREEATSSQARRVRAGLRGEVGHLWLRRGEVSKAIAQLERAHQDLAMTADAEHLALVRARLAEARLLNGDVDEAGRLAVDALQIATEARSSFAELEVRRVALRHARVTGDLSRLGELVYRTERWLAALPADPWRAPVAAQLALGFVELGLPAQAEHWMGQAEELRPEDPYQSLQVRIARLAMSSRSNDTLSAHGLELGQEASHLDLGHLARLAAGFSVHLGSSARGVSLHELVRAARAAGDRYAASWLSVAGEHDANAIRGARALGYLAMSDGRALPA